MQCQETSRWERARQPIIDGQTGQYNEMFIPQPRRWYKEILIYSDALLDVPGFHRRARGERHGPVARGIVSKGSSEDRPQGSALGGDPLSRASLSLPSARRLRRPSRGQGDVRRGAVPASWLLRTEGKGNH